MHVKFIQLFQGRKYYNQRKASLQRRFDMKALATEII